jgi:hypothetical protein
VQQDFFTAEAMARHDEILTRHDMPFVFDLMMGALSIQVPGNGAQEEELADPTAAPHNTDNLVSPDVLAGVSYTQVAGGQDRVYHCAQRVCHRSNII